MSDDELDEREKMRQQGHKASISAESERRRRNDTTVSIRKKKRSEMMKKRRNIPLNNEEEISRVAKKAGYHINADGVASLHNLEPMMEMLNSGDPERELEAATMFRKLLSIENNPPVELVVHAGILDALLHFVGRADCPALQFQCAWALTNIAYCAEFPAVLVEKGAVPLLVALLESTNEDLLEQAVWCLGNIAGDSVELRNAVVAAKPMNHFLRILSYEEVKVSTLRTTAWSLSNLVRGKPQPPWSIIGPALPTAGNLIYARDEQILQDALWTLSYLSDGDEERIQQIIHSGVCARVVELLMHQSPDVQVPALRTVGNIVTGSDTQTQVIINCSVLPCLASLLTSETLSIQKEACWTLSNITAGNHLQIKAVMDCGHLVKDLVDLLAHADSFKTRKEAAWAVANLSSRGTPQQVCSLVDLDVIPPLCELLLVSETRVIMVAMEALAHILAVGAEHARAVGYNMFAIKVDEAGGMEKLDVLQGHKNKDVFTKAQHILETYFGGDDEDEDAAVAPTVTGGQFNFHSGGAPGGGFSFNNF